MKVGFIGLGIMGGKMALNVQAAGHELTVYDVRRAAAEPHLKAGAKWADGPRQVAQQSDIVLTSLPGPPEIEGRFGYNEDLTGLNFRAERAPLDAVFDRLRSTLKEPRPPSIYVGSTEVDVWLPGLRAGNDLVRAGKGDASFGCFSRSGRARACASASRRRPGRLSSASKASRSRPATCT